MWNKPNSEDLAKIPVFYSSEEVPLKKKMIYMHFFLGGCDWYATEYDPGSQTFFGFAILNNDYDMAEWGYFSFKELSDLRVKLLEVDRDLYFMSKKAIEIEKICKAQGWEVLNDRNSQDLPG